MANDQNLIPLNKRRKEDAKRIQQMGADACNEVKRQKKSFSEKMKALLDMPISNCKDYNMVAKMGIDPEEISNKDLIVLALFNQSKYGDVQAIKELKKTIGEDEAPSTDTLDKLDEVLSKIEGKI